MQRIGQCVGLRPEIIDEYKRIHAEVWPEVLSLIGRCNIRNYSIYLKEPENILFAYFEYHGSDWAADMAKMAADPKTREWWTITDPMQVPLEGRREGEWWARMEEVFHTE
jgi:L-rhamnose mutarotase